MLVCLSFEHDSNAELLLANCSVERTKEERSPEAPHNMNTIAIRNDNVHGGSHALNDIMRYVCLAGFAAVRRCLCGQAVVHLSLVKQSVPRHP